MTSLIPSETLQNSNLIRAAIEANGTFRVLLAAFKALVPTTIPRALNFRAV